MEITQSDKHLVFADGTTGAETLVNKGYASVETSGDTVIIRYHDYQNTNDRRLISFEYTEITNFSFADATEASSTISYMLGTMNDSALNQSILNVFLYG